MNLADRKLLREIVIVVILKLVVLTGLWWAFVRDARVTVDAAAVAVQVSAPSHIEFPVTTGDRHGQ